MSEICLQPPSVEPISLAEAKLHMRVTNPSQDARIQLCIAQARGAAEMKTRQQCLHARWKLVLDCFHNAILLPHVPLVNVVEVAYTDLSGDIQIVPSSSYVANIAPMPGVLMPKYGNVWPVPVPQAGAVTVTYNAGYASPMTADHTAGTIAVNGPVSWAVDDVVQFSNSGGALPAPLQLMQQYQIASAAAGVYTLKDLTGNAVALTDDGTGLNFIGAVPAGLRGWMLIRAASLYENREEIAVLMRGSVADIPFMEGLLDEFRTSLP